MRSLCRLIVRPTAAPARASLSLLPLPCPVPSATRAVHLQPLHTLRQSYRVNLKTRHLPQSIPRRNTSRPSSIFSDATTPHPQYSAIDPLSVLVALSIALGAGYLARSYLQPSDPQPVHDTNPEGQYIVETTSTRAYPDMPTQPAPGRPGNLTPEQEQKLKEFWLATLDIFGLQTDSSDAASTGTSTTPATETTASEGGKPKKRLGLFKKKNKDAAAEASEPASDENDKHGQTKEFKEALASTSPEVLRAAFWSMVKHDDPDALLLRFLRARKWDVHNALVMLVATMHWRSDEVHVDSDIMLNGEEGALKASDKDSQDFLQQLRMGKSVIHGVDGEGRPIVTVRVRLHKAGEQTEKSLERYTVYTIETARMLLRGNVDTATIIFDMTGFSMANMDYAPVKFMIKCFEANYPESLGQVLVYKAPWVFNQIWRIIKGWLDPVVASKIHFAKNVDELSNFIPRNRILKELEGDEDWEYKYIEPVSGENKVMSDTATKESLDETRKEMILAYEGDTIKWANGHGHGDQRGSLKDQLRQNYWQLDPYLRARSHYDREGLLGPGEKLDFYPSSSPSAA